MNTTVALLKSVNPIDSLGETDMNKGNKVWAIKNYEKSLQLVQTNRDVEKIKMIE